MSAQPWIGLVLAFISAIITNTAYSLEHDAAAVLPPLSPRRPLQSAAVLLRDKRWVRAFGAESAGWLTYVAALRLAPLALVQAVVASGVAVLAFASARGHPSQLPRRERYAVVLAVAGLIMLALSLVGVEPADHHPAVHAIVIWLAACAGGAAFLIIVPGHFARAASLGLATGLLFADGDISAKLVGYGGAWLVALIPLIAAYAIGTSVLQSAYQHGDALTAAGTATMVTNVIPMLAAFVVFHETLPSGFRAVLQVAAFAALVLSAVLLGRRQAPRRDEDVSAGRSRARSLAPSPPLGTRPSVIARGDHHDCNSADSAQWPAAGTDLDGRYGVRPGGYVRGVDWRRSGPDWRIAVAGGGCRTADTGL